MKWIWYDVELELIGIKEIFIPPAYKVFWGHTKYADGYTVFVFPFVCSFVSWSFSYVSGTLRQSFGLKFLIFVHLSNLSSESIHTSWVLLKKWFSALLLCNSWSDISQPYDIDLCVMRLRSAWPLFRGPVIFLYILKTIWYMKVKLWDNESCDTTFDYKINVGNSGLYFKVILPYILKTNLMDECQTLR